LISAEIALGDDTAAETAVDRLLTNFNDNPLIARAIHDTAWEYRKAGRYDKADQLYQYVVDNQSGNEDMMWVKTGIARLNIALGNDAAAEKTIDILIADFNDQPELATAIFMLGEQYYNKALTAEPEAHFQKAILIWERIIKELPASGMTAQAYYFSARCYELLGEYEMAIEYYQVVIHNWPNYERAWNAQFMIARCYDKLASSGQILTADAAVQIRRGCDKVLANYPDCMAVKAAGNLLKRWNSVNPQ